MSGNLAVALPLKEQAPHGHPRHIEVVPTKEQRKARPRAVYAVVTVGSLFAIFIAQLLLSIVVSDGAYQISSLQSQQRDLLRTEQALVEDLNLLGSTQHLFGQAASLGMVPSAHPAFLRLSDAAVLGAPGSAGAIACPETCAVENSLLNGVPLTLDPVNAGTALAPGDTTALTNGQGTDASGTGASNEPTTGTGSAGQTTGLPSPVTH